MCFTSDKSYKRLPKPKKAKKDIEVYKAIKHNGLGEYFNLIINKKYEGYKKGFHYIETTPFDSRFIEQYFNKLIIHGYAFHSCKDINYCIDHHNGKIRKFIIPKGALYYENQNYYVSSEIIYP